MKQFIAAGGGEEPMVNGYGQSANMKAQRVHDQYLRYLQSFCDN
jgi:hypothetical protein